MDAESRFFAAMQDRNNKIRDTFLLSRPTGSSFDGQERRCRLQRLKSGGGPTPRNGDAQARAVSHFLVQSFEVSVEREY